MNRKTLLIIGIIAAIIILIVAILYFRKKNQLKKNEEIKPIIEEKPEKIEKVTFVNSYSAGNYENLPNGSIPIRFGQKSKLVYLLQYSLNKLHGANLALDGNFGSSTLSSLSKNYKKTQVDKNLYLKILNDMVKAFENDKETAEAINYFNSKVKI